MALPTMIGYLGVPYLGFAYGVTMTMYSGYNAITNLYSFYWEYGTDEFKQKSASAYENLGNIFTTALQQLNDWSGYGISTDNIYQYCYIDDKQIFTNNSHPELIDGWI